MRRTTLGFLVLIGFVLAVYLSGCSTTGFDHPGAGYSQAPSVTPPPSAIRFLENSGSSVLLDVPFLPQVPPGTWYGTRNCGQASAGMIRAYHYGVTPTADDIIRANHWLHEHYNLPLNNGNSDFTNVFMIRAWLGHEGIDTRVGMGNLDQLRAFLQEGKPVLVAVYSDMDPNRGAKHAMVVTGLSNHQVTVNDPGKMDGAGNTYPVSQFLSAWQAQGNWYLTLR